MGGWRCAEKQGGKSDLPVVFVLTQRPGIACERPHRSFVPAHMLAPIGSIEATQVHHGYQPVLPHAQHDRLPHLDEPGNARALPLKLAEFDQQDDTVRSTSIGRYRWYVDA